MEKKKKLCCFQCLILAFILAKSPSDELHEPGKSYELDIYNEENYLCHGKFLSCLCYVL